MAGLSPELLSVDALHAFLEVGTEEAEFLSRYSGYRYRPLLIPKRRGGVRHLLVPEKRLKHLQRQLLGLLEPLYSPRVAVHGFVKQRSPITNANAHQGRPYLLNIDLENYFGSITRNRVNGMLRAIGIAPDVAIAICNLSIANNQLPQGAPTSPLLANMVSFRLDRELTAFAKANKLRYTRYADDITFSSYAQPTALFADDVPASGHVALEVISPELRGIVTSNSFQVNASKTRFAGTETRKEVTGLIVNEFTNVKRSYVRNLRSAVFKVERLGPIEAEKEFKARYKDGEYTLEQVLRGRLEWLAQVRGKSFGPYRTLGLRYNKLFPDNAVAIDPTHEEIALEAIFVIEYAYDAEIIKENKKVREARTIQGTAFFLDSVGLVTAFHNLEKMKSPWAVIYRPHKPTLKYQAKIGHHFCKYRDLAILEHNVPAQEQMFLKAASAIERTRAPVAALGFPSYGPGDGLAERTGQIVGRAKKSSIRLLEVTANLSDGLSGGPIVNDRYEVLAVVHKGGHDAPKNLGVEVAELIELALESGGADKGT